MSEESEPSAPFIITPRFTIYRQEIEREQRFGHRSRTIFTAFPRMVDMPRPVCMVTVWEEFQNFVEWLWVCEHHRRQRIAFDVISAIEGQIGDLMLDGSTDEGLAFCEWYEAQREING